MEGLERLRAKFIIDLHPSRLASPAEGVRAHLSSLLLRYNEDLEGVLLSYRNERVLTQAASIHPYFPFVRVEVAADIVLFRPRLGMRLVGTVNKVGADYVGLLVLGFMNASIAADAIRPEFRPRLAEHCWASSKAAAHRLEVGTKVHFDVAAVRHHGAFVSIAGSLQQPGTGAEGFAKPPKRPTEAAGGGKQQRRKQAAAQQQQQQQTQAAQQQHVQAEQPSGKKDKEKKKEKRAQEAAPVKQQQQQQHQHQQQQQQQQERPVAPQEAAASKKAKKSKQQGDHAAAAPALQAPTAAAGPAADGTRKKDKSEKKEKKKDKKRKANDAQTPAAEAAVAAAPNSSSELKPQRKKKKRMANA